MQPVALAAHGTAAREALWRVIVAAKGGDALAPVTVVVPSTYAGLALRRALAVTAPDAGLVNVRFVPLARLAELLGAPALAAQGRRPLVPAVRAAAVRRVLAGPGPLAPVSHHAATERAVERAVAALTDAADRTAVERLAARSPRAADVVARADAFRAATNGYYDEHDLAAAAADAVRAAAPRGALSDLGELVIHLPRDLSEAETVLVETLVGERRARVVLGGTGDPEADTESQTLAARLGSAARPQLPLAVPPLPRAIVSAPEPADEVAEVIRMVAARLDTGTPLHHIAVLYRAVTPYARLLREQLDAAGIPANGPPAQSLADSVAGRTLLRALALPDDDFVRDAVVSWLSDAPVLAAPGQRAPAARWDALSREAGVVAGIEQWEQRLEHLRAERARLGGALAAAGDDGGAPQRVGDDVDELVRLHAFVGRLGIDLIPPAGAGWSELAAWATGLLDRYLGHEPGRDWPDAEVEALRAVRARVGALASVAEIAGPPTAATFRQALAADLDVPAAPVGRFGTGVFVAPVRAALATDFDVVFVVGMNEGTFPPRPREDALLPDRERTAAGLPAVRERRAARERRDYLAALACAPDRVLTFARADALAQRALRPSRWLLEAASTLHGTVVYGGDLDALEAPWYRIVPSFEGALTADGTAGSLRERDLAALVEAADPGAHAMARADPALASGFAALAARRSRRFGPYDGVVGALPGLAPSVEHPLSPTALEHWAACPFRYFLGRVLRLRVLPRPEELTEIEARRRGSLVHEVLAQFVEEMPHHAPDEAWTRAERERLRAIAEERANEVEATGQSGKPLLWRLARRRILRDLDAALDADEEYRRGWGVVPVAVEAAFGLVANGEPPVTVDLGDGMRVAFRGRIDRIDRAPDGSLLSVVDYKTGRPGDADLADDPVARGRQLQLAVYALAARARFGEARVVSSYWYTRREGADGIDGFELTDGNLERVHQVLRLAVDGIAAGLFPARPGPDDWYRGPENCRSCDFDAVCPVDRLALWEHKRDDPAVRDYVELAAPEELVGSGSPR